MNPTQKLRQEILEQVLQHQGGPLGPLKPEEVLEASQIYVDWIMGTITVQVEVVGTK